MPQEQNPKQAKSARPSPMMSAFVRAERLMQIAFVLPGSVFVGWIAGAALDKWLHQHWIYLAGLALGAVMGFVQVFRIVLGNEKEMEKEDR
ncbi:MAG: AtpZ/AtpI family protein [Acidobacteriaceae bacterium]